jgi:UDP-glucose 4-epimerase
MVERDPVPGPSPGGSATRGGSVTAFAEGGPLRVVITGGAGFIGANLVRGLAGSDHVSEIAVVDDLSTGRRSNLAGADVEFHEGSILDPELLDRAFANADAIVHLAARPSVPRSVADPVTSHDVNATGTVQVLEAARRVGGPQVVVASSSSVYGRNVAMPKSEDLAPQPLSPYAASKLATESYALAYASCYGLEVIVFRFFNVFGPLQPAGHAYAAAIPAFIDAALAGRPLPIYGDGRQTRDFTYVGTVAAVVSDALRRRVAWPGPVNLAFGDHRTLLDVVDQIEEIVGEPLERSFGSPRPGDVLHSQADQTQLRRLFSEVKEIGFREGLAQTVEWFRSVR